MNFKTGTRTALSALLALTGLAFGADYSSWAKYRTVTVNTSSLGLGGSVANIPIVVRFNATDHADMLNGGTQILPDGADIRVTKADGTTDVPFEIESATTGASGSLVLWIKAETVAQNSATAATFRVYWNKTGVTSLSNGKAVFDTANGFVAVYHMNKPTVNAGDTLHDVTYGGHHGIAGLQGSGNGVSIPGDTAGVLGTGKVFRGTAGTTELTTGGFYTLLNNDSALNLSVGNKPYSITAWANPAVCHTTARVAVISKYVPNDGPPTNGRAYALQTLNAANGAWRFTAAPAEFGGTTGTNPEFVANALCTPNQWTFLGGVYNPNGNPPTPDAAGAMSARLFLNDTLSAAASGASSVNQVSIGNAATPYIGRVHTNTRFMRGAVDEIVVSKVARDSNWLKVTYQTQKPAATAVTVSSTTDNVPVTGPYASWSGHHSITLNTSATGANVAGDELNFPVLVRLGPAEAGILSGANGGASVRFTKADDMTVLPFQIESWSSTAAAIWVKVDTVKGNNATQSIRLHYGKTGVLDSSNAAAVFDTANGFVGAWQLGNAAGANPRPSAVPGAPAAIVRNVAVGYQPVRGIIGMADSIAGGAADAVGGIAQGTRQYIDMRGTYDGYNNLSTGASYSVWINPNAALGVNGFARFLQMTSGDSSGAPPANSRLAFLYHSGNAGSLAVRHGTLGGNTNAVSITPGTWVNLSFSKTGAGNTKVYLNGDSIHVYGDNAALKDTVRSHVWIGRSWDPANEYLNAKVDNAVLSKVGRSSNWMRLAYQNQRAANKLTNTGVLAAPAAPTGVSAVAASATTATVSWTAVSAAEVTYKAFAVQDTAKSCFTTGVSCTVTGLTTGSSYTFQVRAVNDAGVSGLSSPSASIAISAYGAYTGHRDIILNTTASGANVAATVTNFPVLIRLGSTESAILTGANGGASIRFSKADDATALPYQIESWTSTAAAIWVRVDSVKGNTNTHKIRLHYGNGSVTSQSSGSAVFDTAQYVAVYHLVDSLDATVNANHGTATTAAPAVATSPLIGGAKTFNGTSNWYQIGTDSTALNLNTDTGPYTLSAWVNPASCDARIAAIAKYTNGATPPGRQFALHTTQGFTDWRLTNGTTAVAGEFTADAPGSCVTGTWSHIVGTYRSGATPTTDSSVNTKIYVNGVLAGQGVTVTTTGAGRSANAYIGRIHGTERYMNGTLDEITVAKVARDSNWIKLAYQNQKAGNQLVDIGSVATIPGAPASITASASTTTTGAVVVSWTAPASNGGATVTSYTVTGSPAGTCTTSALTCTISGLTVGTLHTFSVRASNAIGQGPVSGNATATPVTGIAGGNYLIHTDGFARAYTFRLPEGAQAVTENLKMTITDVYGRTVWSRTVSPKETRSREISWNGKNSKGATVSAGMYIVRVKVDVGGVSQELTRTGATLQPGK
jgi:hypothetical protein